MQKNKQEFVHIAFFFESQLEHRYRSHNTRREQFKNWFD